VPLGLAINPLFEIQAADSLLKPDFKPCDIFKIYFKAGKVFCLPCL